jgi:hypothetical protein
LLYKQARQAVLVCLGSSFARFVAQRTAKFVFNTRPEEGQLQSSRSRTRMCVGVAAAAFRPPAVVLEAPPRCANLCCSCGGSSAPAATSCAGPHMAEDIDCIGDGASCWMRCAKVWDWCHACGQHVPQQHRISKNYRVCAHHWQLSCYRRRRA